MKRGMGIGAILLIGGLWLILRKPAEAQAATLLPYPSYPSEYELLHKVVPITKYEEKKIPVFTSFEEWEEATNG